MKQFIYIRHGQRPRTQNDHDSNELEIIRKELFLKGIGNINSGYYWSSIELGPNKATYIRMDDGITQNFYFQEDYKKKKQMNI